jgi:hypothetical protein
MAHHQAQAVGLGLRAFLQRGDLFEVAFEQLSEGGRLGLGAGDEGAFVHLDLDGARPLLGRGTGLEGFGLKRVACRTGSPNAAKPRDGRKRLSDLGLPLVGTAFSEGGHRHTPLVRERV